MTDDWRTLAACKGMGDETYADETQDPFYTPGGGTPNAYDNARAICASCPVAVECLTDAFNTETSGQRYGFRGGLTPEQRTAAWRKARRHGAPLPAPTTTITHRKVYVTPEVAAQRIDLWKLGRTDQEIADATGLETLAIRKWRNDNNLTRNQPAPDIDHAARARAWEAGMTDNQIADATNTTRGATSRWRSRRGLTARKAAS